MSFSDSLRGWGWRFKKVELGVMSALLFLLLQHFSWQPCDWLSSFWSFICPFNHLKFSVAIATNSKKFEMIRVWYSKFNTMATLRLYSHRCFHGEFAQGWQELPRNQLNRFSVQNPHSFSLSRSREWAYLSRECVVGWLCASFLFVQRFLLKLSRQVFSSHRRYSYQTLDWAIKNPN